MKNNWKSYLMYILETLCVVSPTFVYLMCLYDEFLKETMTIEHKTGFWVIIGSILVALPVIGIFLFKYKDLVEDYRNSNANIRTNQYVKQEAVSDIARMKSFIDTMRWLIVSIPFILLLLVLEAFQNNIEQLMILLECVLCGVLGKVVIHFGTIQVQKLGVKNNE